MATWTFISNHGAILALIGQQNTITAREIATQLGITERSVRRIINDLESEGYIERQREGRVNTYKVNRNGKLRRHETRDVEVGELLRVLKQHEGKA